MTEEQVEIFLKLQPQIKSAYDEITLLSKKKPTEPLNKFKLKFINSMLNQANHILQNDYIPFPDEFEQFDVDDMPNNGDVVFILSHYLTSLEKLRCDNIKYQKHYYYWVIDGEVSTLKTSPPCIK
ncbi:hypothetical protein Dacet_0752 [Denitrovibrio acetiphilus DSM 12809]|uniref:Uncharacterized protein n=1 Tax=Denitrovibrio acetiphilus (strain DSM 12809 / NBRC 114555 / N2460) TaxID=522772 RepID=D4H5B6_DENA2|nr:hypothetical protein [Denitrovibrio acetiphilus]ADD67536.1 hypothetical protein Dacet_0752 [Denitrovibrio acetiphilus DSM 12809]